ncbi:MAG: DnaA regulatory inactivator Hda [Chromatiaceae bacterium]|jgi:DnaA family protein|nr:DnaA regulatory inactivator Hda [Chromatiaceae bacterium]
MEQLTLAIAPRPEADFSDYLPGPNGEALAAIADWAAGRGDPFLYLFGASGSGKTHLLQAACCEAARRGRRALYLPLDHAGLTPAALEDLEQVDHLGLDAIQTRAGDPAWEQALFGAYNRLRDTGRRLLVAAHVPLAELPIALPDLRSRLGWGPAYRLRLLREGDCALLVRQAAERRGLRLTEAAVAFIMRRSPRDPRALLDLLDELDRLCLRHQRRPSIWLLRRLLDADQPSPSSPADAAHRASGND